MKWTLLAAFMFLSCASFGQERPSVNLRLDMASDELIKSAAWGDAAIGGALLGGAMAAIAFGGKERDGWIVTGIAVAATYTFTLKANGHKRTAARLLHQ